MYFLLLFIWNIPHFNLSLADFSFDFGSCFGCIAFLENFIHVRLEFKCSSGCPGTCSVEKSVELPASASGVLGLKPAIPPPITHLNGRVSLHHKLDLTINTSSQLLPTLWIDLLFYMCVPDWKYRAVLTFLPSMLSPQYYSKSPRISVPCLWKPPKLYCDVMWTRGKDCSSNTY